jgi:hypothetical protein
MATSKLKPERLIDSQLLSGTNDRSAINHEGNYFGMPDGLEYASDEVDEEYEEIFDQSENNPDGMYSMNNEEGLTENFENFEPSINFGVDNQNETDLNDEPGYFLPQTNGATNGVKRSVSNGTTNLNHAQTVNTNSNALHEESQKIFYERLVANYKRLKENCDQFESDFNYEVSRMSLMQSRFSELKRQVDLQQELFEAYIKPKTVNMPPVPQKTKQVLLFKPSNPQVF